MKLRMYESEVKTAVPKITKVTKDSQSYLTFLFSDWRILDYLEHSKDLKIRKSYLDLWDTLKENCNAKIS